MQRFFLFLKTYLGHGTTLTSYAFRDVIKSRIILVLIVTSLSIAFASVFLSTSILQGFRFILVSGAQGYLGDLLIAPSDDAESIPRLEAVQNALRMNSNIQSFSVRSDGFVSVEHEDKTVTPYRTIGINPTQEAQTTHLADNVIAGRFIKDSDQNAVVIGLTLADFLVGLDYDGKRIDVGNTIDVTTPDGAVKTYTIVGIIDAKTFLPNLFLILPERELLSLYGSHEHSEIAIRLKDEMRWQETQRTIEDSVSDIDIIPWSKDAGYVNDIIRAVTFIMGLINTLLTFSVFIIMSIIIFINVFQKRRQIGIIKSMGASNTYIVFIYVLEATTYGVISYILGFILYWIIHQYSLHNPVPLLIGDFHTVFDTQTILLSVITLSVAALGGSVVPAYVAARTKIVDVIRDSV